MRWPMTAAVMVNPDNTWVDYLTVKELKIWERLPKGGDEVGDVRAVFPDRTINLFGGPFRTFDYFKPLTANWQQPRRFHRQRR